MMHSTTAKLRKLARPTIGKSAPKIRPKPEEFTYVTGTSSLGMVLAAFSEFGLTALLIGKSHKQLLERLQDRFPKVTLHEGDRATVLALTRIIKLIDMLKTGDINISLDIRGTVFQRRVWQEASKIPLGQTSTYSAIAAAIGSPQSMRAVGSACTNNLFALIIPCHRVLHKGENGLGKASKRQAEFLRREANAVEP